MKNGTAKLVAIVYAAILFSCKDKQADEPDNNYLPVASIINDQVKGIDTSLFSIIKVNYKNNVAVDTEYIRREDVRPIVKEFLEIPRLSKKAYTEENIPGPTEGLSTITYTATDPGKEIRRIDLVVDPKLSQTGQSVITSIFIDKSFSNKDSAVQKKMLWRMDQSCQVTTILQKKGEAEETNTFRLIWNDAIGE